jgi:glycyl-tRNA synthetase
MHIVKKNISGHDYYYLNKSVREGSKVRSINVAYLGKDKVDAERKAKEIIEKLKSEKTLKEADEIIKQSKKKELRNQESKKGSEEKEFTSFIQEKGLIWGPSPEIYGGLAGFYTYGPVGKLLKNKVENSVRKIFNANGLRELEAPTVLPDIVWKASGHLETFTDKVIKCSKCNAIFRADKLIEEGRDISADSFSDKKILDFIKKQNIKCPSCKGRFENKITTQNLMMKTKVAGDDASLRPETATATYLPFLRFYNYFRKKLPLGVFQIGKAYRNEISPRQNVIRGREFTQAEGQIFVDPETKNSWEKYSEIKNEKLPFWDYKSQDKNNEINEITVEQALKKGFIKSQAYGWCIWLAYTQFINFGIPKEKIRLRQHHPDEKAFYADDAWDIEIKLNSFGWTEVCGVHDRTDYDLKQHSKFSNVELQAQRENGEKFFPHVLEIAFGTDRPAYALIDIFYEKKEEGEGKTMLKVPYYMAPMEVSIFPLIKKPELIKISEEIKDELENYFVIDYDVTGSVGRRYLRSSTIGTPYAITIDFDSLKNKDCTIRDRDTTKQIRVKIKDLKDILRKLIDEEVEFIKAGKLVK